MNKRGNRGRKKTTTPKEPIQENIESDKSLLESILSIEQEHKELYNELKDESVSNLLLDIIKQLHTEIHTHYKLTLKAKINNCNRSISLRITKNEKLEYIQSEINATRPMLESVFANAFQNTFENTLSDSYSQITNFNAIFNTDDKSAEKLSETLKETKGDELSEYDRKMFSLILPKDSNLLSKDSIDFNELITELYSKPENLMKNIIIIKSEIESNKEYFYFLKGKYSEIEADNNSQNTLPNQQEKIAWQGTQKQLAELFIELKEKGWINEIKSNLISNYFTNANTIGQILKPSINNTTKEPIYDQVYTKAYKPSFDKIALKPNKK